MDIGYVAVETFIPNEKYKEWSGLFQAKEIVSLDCLLCRSILEDDCIKDKYRYSEEYGFYYDILNNLDVLLTWLKIKKKSKYLQFRENLNMIAVISY